MTPEDALEFLVSEHRYPAGDREAYSALENVLRRDWAVRVLDAWAEQGVDYDYEVVQHRWQEQPGGALYFVCWFAPYRGEPRVEIGNRPGATRYAARLAAAEAVWPELPASVRLAAAGESLLSEAGS